MRPNDAIHLVDTIVRCHSENHYITTPDMRRMAGAVIAEMEPPANVPGVTFQQVIAAAKKVRDSRADPLRPRSQAS